MNMEKEARTIEEGKLEGEKGKGTYPAMVGAFFPFRDTVFFYCFFGLSASGSEAVEAPVPEAAATAARLRGFGAGPGGLAELDGRG